MSLLSLFALFDIIKNRYLDWKDRRFLKKHDCDNWKQYNRNYDSDTFRQSCNIKQFYHGYKYVYCIESISHYAYELLYDYGPGGFRYGYHDIEDWCEKYCTDKHRIDLHRVLRSYNNEWVMNDIGGNLYLFFAFKNEKDYCHFLLRWS